MGPVAYMRNGPVCGFSLDGRASAAAAMTMDRIPTARSQAPVSSTLAFCRCAVSAQETRFGRQTSNLLMQSYMPQSNLLYGHFCDCKFQLAMDGCIAGLLGWKVPNLGPRSSFPGRDSTAAHLGAARKGRPPAASA